MLERVLEERMKNNQREGMITRRSLLKLLSDEEVASVSRAETAARLDDGEEYLDLARLERGVRRAGGLTPTGRVLPRKAVRESTWLKIVEQLTMLRRAMQN
jgi:hypothetical protein